MQLRSSGISIKGINSGNSASHIGMQTRSKKKSTEIAIKGNFSASIAINSTVIRTSHSENASRLEVKPMAM